MPSEPFLEKVTQLAGDLSELHRLVDHLTPEQRESFPELIRRLQHAIKELHAAEAKLREQNRGLITAQALVDEERERYRELFHSAPDGYVVTTMEGVILEANEAMHALAGVREPELRGKPLILYLSPASRPAVVGMLQLFREELGAGSPEPMDVEAVLATQGQGAVHVSIHAVTGPGLEGATVRWMIRDVTERHRAQEILRQVNAELEERVAQRTAELEIARQRAEAASETKDRFLAALSHELRTPLTPVLTLVTMMERDEALPEEVRRRLGTVRQNVDLETRLIDDLLDINRIANGKLALHKASVDLRTVLRQAYEICCHSGVLAKPLTIDMQLADEAHPVVGDSARLTQVFCNLLQNALKFTPAGGRIRISTRLRHGAEGAERGAGERRVAVELQDNGMGIAAELLPSLFRAFEQGGTRVTQQYGGLGLGLAISKAIVELHGGTISVKSGGPGTGATFMVELPAEAGAAPAASPVTEKWDGRPLGESGKWRVLLVEDHAATARVLRTLLERMGLEVMTAGSVQEALAASATCTFDLVISDLGLPDGTGTELMQVLRERHAARGICLSGYGTDRDMASTAAAGFSHHLVKPVNIDELAGILKAMLERK